LEGTVNFDGVPDEAAWQDIAPFKMVTQFPLFGLEPTEKTDVRVTYDDEYIYIGASLYAEDPSLILSSTKKRDDSGDNNDWLGVLFDTYNDYENAVGFQTNPSGLRTDLTVSNDGIASFGEPPLNSSWNTFWDVETRINDEGWFIEMRIPISSLRFQEKNGEVLMGMILFRWVPYLNETYIYPAISNEYGGYSMLKISRAQKVVFRNLRSRKPLYVSPYIIGGFTQLNEQNDDGSAYEYDRREKLNAGLDLKYGISSNLTLDVTLNTDFAQVEADDEKVNLTRYNLFFEEKRQFFLERASLFNFNTISSSTLFHSRRIGLDDDFNPVPIIGGIRLVGRKGQLDAGFLSMQTAGTDSLPSENFSVLRLKRKVINENSYIGGILTSRVGMDGSYNEVYGLDAIIRMTGDEYLKLRWSQSFEHGMENRPFAMENGTYLVNWERWKNVGFYYDIFIGGAGKDFHPGIGFQYREDFHYFGGIFNYTWLMGKHSPIMKHGPGFMNINSLSQSRGVYDSRDIGVFYELQMKNYWSFMTALIYNYENVFELFEISDDTHVLVGEYSYPSIYSTVSTPLTKPAFAELRFQGGGYYDGNLVSITLEPGWNMSSSFILSGAYIFNKIDFSERDQHFMGHIGRLKALYMFSTKLSASVFIQYNSAIYNVNSNFRLRYNPREGNDLYIVYNEGANTDLGREMLDIPRMSDRTLMLKYTYTFRL